MFGKRAEATALKPQAAPAAPKKEDVKSSLDAPLHNTSAPARRSDEPSEEYYETKATIFNALFETIDVSALAGMNAEKAREEIRTIVDEIIAIRNVRLSVNEQNQLITEICDDILRVNVIAPPLSIDGPALTIRKFKKDKLRLADLVNFQSISPAGAKVLQIIGACQCNIVISGGTGSGKTTLLNALTGFIHPDERIITCEDAAELQLQQPHVVRLETRPPNLEGKGKITMADLVKNCLRMRPERIIVGEVRGPEAFDLLQAMNTGHDGSMGTLHANSPREALSRLESMITMGGFSLPAKTIREMIVGSVDVIVQAARLRDGSRRITKITEVIGMEGDVIVTQDLIVYEMDGEDADGNIIGEHKSTGIARPAFWDRARYFNLERDLAEALDAAGS